MKNFFFIAFHSAAQAILIVLLKDNKASKLKHKLKQLLNFYYTLRAILMPLYSY